MVTADEVGGITVFEALGLPDRERPAPVPPAERARTSQLDSRLQSDVGGTGVRGSTKFIALAALFAGGFLLAGGLAFGRATQFTTTETRTATLHETATSTVHETTTEPGTTVTETTATTVPETAPGTTVVSTLLQTTTRRVFVQPPSTTTSGSSTSSTPTWVWVLLAILAAAVIGLVVVLLTRKGRGAASPAERRQRLDGAVASWAAQGWALESETADSAVLRRGGERMVVSVDEAGQVSARPLMSP